MTSNHVSQIPHKFGSVSKRMHVCKRKHIEQDLNGVGQYKQAFLIITSISHNVNFIQVILDFRDKGGEGREREKEGTAINVCGFWSFKRIMSKG